MRRRTAAFPTGDLSETPLEPTRIISSSEAELTLAFSDVKADRLDVLVVQPRAHIRQKVAE